MVTKNTHTNRTKQTTGNVKEYTNGFVDLRFVYL